MKETSHVFTVVSDYVLGLLPAGEQQKVEQHIADCIECRQAIQHESQISYAVRSTLHTATQPTPGRLSLFMPSIPTRRGSLFGFLWQKQLAPVGLLLILLLGGWGVVQTGQSTLWASPSPPFLPATATMTDVPTVTLADLHALDEEISTAVATVPTYFESMATPAPNPTPATAVGQTSTSNQ